MAASGLLFAAYLAAVEVSSNDALESKNATDTNGSRKTTWSHIQDLLFEQNPIQTGVIISSSVIILFTVCFLCCRRRCARQGSGNSETPWGDCENSEVTPVYGNVTDVQHSKRTDGTEQKVDPASEELCYASVKHKDPGEESHRIRCEQTSEYAAIVLH